MWSIWKANTYTSEDKMHKASKIRQQSHEHLYTKTGLAGNRTMNCQRALACV